MQDTERNRDQHIIMLVLLRALEVKHRLHETFILSPIRNTNSLSQYGLDSLSRDAYTLNTI